MTCAASPGSPKVEAEVDLLQPQRAVELPHRHHGVERAGAAGYPAAPLPLSGLLGEAVQPSAGLCLHRTEASSLVLSCCLRHRSLIEWAGHSRGRTKSQTAQLFILP